MTAPNKTGKKAIGMRWLRRLLWIPLLWVVALVGLNLILLLPATRSKMESLLQTQFGAPATVGSATWWPPFLPLAINDITIGACEETDGKPLFEIKHVLLSFNTVSLLTGRFELEKVIVVEPIASVIRTKNGRLLIPLPQGKVRPPADLDPVVAMAGPTVLPAQPGPNPSTESNPSRVPSPGNGSPPATTPTPPVSGPPSSIDPASSSSHGIYVPSLGKRIELGLISANGIGMRFTDSTGEGDPFWEWLGASLTLDLTGAQGKGQLKLGNMMLENSVLPINVEAPVTLGEEGSVRMGPLAGTFCHGDVSGDILVNPTVAGMPLRFSVRIDRMQTGSFQRFLLKHLGVIVHGGDVSLQIEVQGYASVPEQLRAIIHVFGEGQVATLGKNNPLGSYLPPLPSPDWRVTHFSLPLLHQGGAWAVNNAFVATEPVHLKASGIMDAKNNIRAMAQVFLSEDGSIYAQKATSAMGLPAPFFIESAGSHWKTMQVKMAGPPSHLLWQWNPQMKPMSLKEIFEKEKTTSPGVP